MKAALFLFALIGATCALQFPLEYNYSYEGRLALAIPKLSPRVSAMGIRCTLVLQMKSHGVGLVQLKEVETGTFIGDSSTHLRARVPIEYSQLSKHAKEITEPFAVNFLETKDHVMTVPKGEVEFITNLKKGIVEMFLLDPLISNHVNNMFTKKEAMSRVYTVEEESIFGRCNSIYSITPIPMHDIPAIMHEMKEDVQKMGPSQPRTTSIPDNSGKYWKLIRTIDFDSCNDRVILEHAGYGHYNKTGHGIFEAVSSRSSVGSYVMKGEPGAFRVERAIVEGTVVKNSFGYQSEKMESLTNQTLILISVNSPTSSMVLPNDVKEVKTWRYEVVSPFSPPSGVRKPWVTYMSKTDKFTPVAPYIYLTGRIPTTQKLEEAKEAILKLLEDAAQEIAPLVPIFKETLSPNSYDAIVAVKRLREAQMIITGLPVKTIEEIFATIFQSNDRIGQIKQSLLIDVAAASGAAPPMKVLLEKMGNAKQITLRRMSTIFMTITNHLTSPIILPELMSFVKTVSLKTYEGPQILINFANLLNRICLNRPGVNYTLPNPIFGQYVCKPSFISNEFVPFLKEKLESSQTINEKLTVIQAMSHLGSPQLLDVIRPIIVGTTSNSQLMNPLVRSAAIYCLARGKLPSTLRTEIMVILTEIIDNRAQPSGLRQAAVAVLISWEPHAAIWHKLARQTWREHSQQLSAFIYSTIDNMAYSTAPHHRSQLIIAKYVRGLAKPFVHSIMHSYNYHHTSNLQHDKLSLHTNIARIMNPHTDSLIPREFYIAFKPNYGGILKTMAELAVVTQGLNNELFETLTKMYPHSPHSTEGRMPRESEETERRVGILTRVMDNIIQYLPIDTEWMSDIFGPEGSTYLDELVQGKVFNITKYISPMTHNSFQPTEIGIPLLGMTSIPMIIQSDGAVRLEIPNKSKITFTDLHQAKRVHLLFKTSTKLVSKMHTSLRVITPWDEKEIFIQIDNVRAVNLPIYANISLVREAHLKNLTMNFAPIEGIPNFPVIYAHNVPFVGIKPLLTNTIGKGKYEPLTIDSSKKPLHKVVVKSNSTITGIESELVFEGDTPSPYSLGYLVYLLNYPPKLMKLFSSPTSKIWRTYYMVKPESSATKNVSLSLSFTHFGKIFEEPKLSSSSGSSTKLPKFSPDDTMEERFQKIQEMVKDEEPTIGLNAQLFFNGSEFRKYDLLFVASRQTPINVKSKHYGLVLALMGSPLTNKERKTKVLSMETKVETPSYNERSGLLEMLNGGEIHEKLTGRITIGSTTNDKKMASFEVHVGVSEKRKQLLTTEITNLCSYDPLDPINHLRTPAIYDEATIKVEYDENVIPPIVMNKTMLVVDFIRGMHYPFTTVNRYQVNNPQNKITIQVERPTYSDFYVIRSKAPKENAIVDHVFIPRQLVSIMPLRKLSGKCHPNGGEILISTTPPPTACIIHKNEVRTFDAVTYPFDLLKCGTVVVKNFKDISNSFKVYILKTSSNVVGIFIRLINNKYDVKVTHDSVVINGKPMNGQSQQIKDSEGKIIIDIKKTPGFVRTAIPGEVLVMTRKTEVEILPLSKEKNAYRGLCGDFDGNQMYDMTGPKEGIYTNSTLFKLSWTEEHGQQCDSSKLKKEKELVTEYQKHCPHRGSKQQITLYETEKSDCIMYVYPIKKQDSYLCISDSPIQMCKSGCKLRNKELEQLHSKCWTEAKAPQEVKSGYKQGYLPHPVNEMPEVRKTLFYIYAKQCSPASL